MTKIYPLSCRVLHFIEVTDEKGITEASEEKEKNSSEYGKANTVQSN